LSNSYCVIVLLSNKKLLTSTWRRRRIQFWFKNQTEHASGCAFKSIVYTSFQVISCPKSIDNIVRLSSSSTTTATTTNSICSCQ